MLSQLLNPLKGILTIKSSLSCNENRNKQKIKIKKKVNQGSYYQKTTVSLSFFYQVNCANRHIIKSLQTDP